MKKKVRGGGGGGGECKLGWWVFVYVFASVGAQFIFHYIYGLLGKV